MVFYFTSSNCRLIRNILVDYEMETEISPNEYMTTYVASCPPNFNDSKIVWISNTFLSLQKHIHFFRKIAWYLSETLTPEEQDYFIIVMQAITFQLEPVDIRNIFKTLHNLSLDLKHTFTDFLSNNESLTYIADVAKNYFDSTYITEHIIAPLFKWQPYISEMAHENARYTKKMQERKMKPLTVPVEPTMLKRKTYKEMRKVPSDPTFQTNSQNAVIHKNRKMLSKSSIDKKLKLQHEQNKQKSTELINSSKAYEHLFPRLHKKKNNAVPETPSDAPTFRKPKKIVAKSSLPPIRENAATIKRFNHRVKVSEEKEVEWLELLVTYSENHNHVERIIEQSRFDAQQERIYEIERKHLLGQISHEQAAIAKKSVVDYNKKLVEDILKAKKEWETVIENFKQEYLRKNRKKITEGNALLEFGIQESKNIVLAKKKERAQKLKKQMKAERDEILQQKHKELEEKIKMIKEVRALAMIFKRTKIPKVIDLTETSGIGALCEMSIAELQERIVAMKIEIKEEIERKKTVVNENKEIAKKILEEQKTNVKEYFDDYKKARAKVTKKVPVILMGEKKAAIDDLKNILNKTRAQRLKLVEGADYAEFANFLE